MNDRQDVNYEDIQKGFQYIPLHLLIKVITKHTMLNLFQSQLNILNALFTYFNDHISRILIVIFFQNFYFFFILIYTNIIILLHGHFLPLNSWPVVTY